jgi:GT2 family glycosyltransferase
MSKKLIDIIDVSDQKDIISESNDNWYKKRFAIGIPTVNRFDLLKPSLESYLQDFPNVKVFIVDNGKQGIAEHYKDNELVTVFEPENNLGVAGSWNLLCKEIFKLHGYALLLNDDIYLGYGTEVVEKAIYWDNLGLTQSSKNFSVVLLSNALYTELGAFDEQFYPAYFEDSDYLYRLKLKKKCLQRIDYSLDPRDFMASQTYEKEPQKYMNIIFENKERYIKKWGGLPFMEQYRKPYTPSN